MTTIIINEETKIGRLVLDLIREIGVGEIIDNRLKSDNILNDITINAIR